MASEAMRARFKEEMERGSKLPPREKKPKAQRTRAPLKPGKGPKQVSENRGLTKLILAAYRDAFIHLARRYDDLRCWECGLECKPSELDLHHINRRGQGGQHKAFNLMLVCNGKSRNGEANCHARLDGNDVRWSA